MSPCKISQEMPPTNMSDAQHKSAHKSVDEQLAYIRKGAAEIIPEAELRAKLEQSVKSGKPLRVYRRRSHRSRHSPRPHRRSAQAETFPGHGSHRDFPHR